MRDCAFAKHSDISQGFSRTVVAPACSSLTRSAVLLTGDSTSIGMGLACRMVSKRAIPFTFVKEMSMITMQKGCRIYSGSIFSAGNVYWTSVVSSCRASLISRQILRSSSTTNTCFFTAAPPWIGCRYVVSRIKKRRQGQQMLPLFFIVKLSSANRYINCFVGINLPGPVFSYTQRRFSLNSKALDLALSVLCPVWNAFCGMFFDLTECAWAD